MGTIRGATAQDTPLPWIASSGEEGGEVSGVTSENELLLLDEDAMAPGGRNKELWKVYPDLYAPPSRKTFCLTKHAGNRYLQIHTSRQEVPSDLKKQNDIFRTETLRRLYHEPFRIQKEKLH